MDHPNVHKIVGLSGGYNTQEACRRLTQNEGMTASFSRALSESLFAHQSDDEFDMTMSINIAHIVEAGR